MQNQMSIFTYNKMQHGNGEFSAKNVTFTIKILPKITNTDTCFHKHELEKTNTRQVSFQEKEIKKSFFITFNNIFQ